MKKTHLIYLLLLPLILINLIRCDPGGEPSTNQWQVPVDVANDTNATQKDYYNLGWQSFIAFNWPADASYRGKPDTTKSLGAMDSTGDNVTAVWESWRNQEDIFLPKGVKPASWDSGYKGMKQLNMFSKFDGNIQVELEEATNNPLIDQDSQYVRYEVRTCQSEFTYFYINTYYNSAAQVQAVANGTFQSFPRGGTGPKSFMPAGLPSWALFGASEVKASWRVFKPGTSAAILNRYFHRKAVVNNTKSINKRDTVEVGLIGLHILRLTQTTPSTWYWASFEQVDNLTLQPQYGGTLPAAPTFNTNPPKNYGDSGYSYIPNVVNLHAPLNDYPVGLSSAPFRNPDSLLTDINAYFHNLPLIKGTPFQYYEMIGSVNPVPKGSSKSFSSDTGTFGSFPTVTVNTPKMANSTLETYMIPKNWTPSSNCITCHGVGSPYLPVSIPLTGTYQVFTFLPGLAQNAATAFNNSKKTKKDKK